jgi:hypothetical protein
MSVGSRSKCSRTDDPAERPSSAWSIVATCFGLLWVGSIAYAEPPQTAASSAASGSTVSATAQQKTLEAELQQFAKLPVDKAIVVYRKALREESGAQSAYEPLQEQVHREYVAKYESIFKGSVPQDLKDAFKRMANRDARRGRLVEISQMKEAERGSAVAKDAAEDRRLEKLRQQFDDDLDHDRIPAVLNFVSSNKGTARRVQEQEANLHAVQAKVDKFEASLFPRLEHDQVVEVRRFVYSELERAKDELQARMKAIDDICNEAMPKELHSMTPPELDNVLRKNLDPEAATVRRLVELHSMAPSDRKAALRKDAEENRKFEEISKRFDNDLKRRGLPLTVKFDLDAKEALKRKFWQQGKIARLQARFDKLDAL